MLGVKAGIGPKLGRNVLALSAVSFLTDVSSEMIYPLLPIFLTSVLGASASFIGAIEGAAETTASLLKLASGWWSDRVAKRKPLVVLGYGIASLARPLVAIAQSASQVLEIRVADRVGHLKVMRVLAVIGAATTASFILLDRFGFMAVAVFVAGATLASISPVSLALQGVVTEPWNYSRSNAIYNAFYAAGMLLGPPVSSVLFERFSGAGMLAHLAVLWVAFAVFGLVYAKDDPAAARA